MTRFRLQIQFQEIDLSQAVTVIGRSSDCNITIEDPLVSREHARVVVEGDDAFIEELRSRNGVWVNGELVTSVRRLRDQDRIRIGMQEIVFHAHATDRGKSKATATGALRICVECACPYLEGSPVCSTCGHDKTGASDGTAWSSGGAGPAWTVQLLLELMDRAYTLGRLDESERVLLRASVVVDKHLDAAELASVDLDPLLSIASKIAQVLADERWARWIVDTCTKARCFPSSEVVGRLLSISFRDHAAMERSINNLLGGREARSAREVDDVAALIQWRSAITART